MKRIALITSGGLVAPAMATFILFPSFSSDAKSSNVLPTNSLSNFHITELSLPFSQAPKQSSITQTAHQINEKKTDSSLWRTEIIQKNDALSSVFERAGVGVSQAYALTNNSKQAHRLASKLKPGKKINFLFDDDGSWQKIRFIEDKLHYTEITHLEDGYDVQAISVKPDIIYAYAEATIENSLFGSANAAGLDDRLTMKLASLFGWDIDFTWDIRQGDSFYLVYEELFLNGERIGNGDIVAAEFRNNDKTYRAVRYINKLGDSHYFTPEGDSMRKAFLRSPVDFARISSRFNLKRKHPILHTIRAHKGTDYAAGRGTPIRATGAGTIRHKGTKGGYGRAIIIQHGQSYETLYAHMNSYAHSLRKGSKVKQGQVIGYVGSSGLATGPHLHYEFHVNGIPRNPVKVKFPKTASIESTEKPRFYAQTSKHLLQLASYLGEPSSSLHLARAD